MKFFQKIQLLSPGLKFHKLLNNPGIIRQALNLKNQHASLTTKPFGHSVTFISENDSEAQKLCNVPDLSKYSSDGRPLTILFPWVHAKPSGVKSYIKFYTDLGFDVLQVRINAYELAFPWNIDQVIKNQVLPALLTSPHENKFIHGFSVGGCVYSQLISQFVKDPSTYRDLIESIQCQIFDSCTDITGAKGGISTSLFPNSPPLQKFIRKCLDFYMDKFPRSMNFLVESSHNLYNRPLPVPALFLYSKADKIGTFETNEGIQESWKKRGVNCTKKVWEDSPHVLHMKTYPKEYQGLVKKFLVSNGLLKSLEAKEPYLSWEEELSPASGSIHQLPLSSHSSLNKDILYFSRKDI